MSFCNLHGHTTFSFLDGMGTPEQVCERIVDLGQKYVAVTDHGNVFAHVPYSKIVNKYDLKIIYGMEAYIVPDVQDRSPVLESRGAGSFPHITLLARTQKGYKNLMQLHKKSWEQGFYYKNRIDYSMLFQHQEGLTVLSGCVGGLPLSFLKEKMVKSKVNQYKSNYIFQDESVHKCMFHVELMQRYIEHYYAEFIPTPGYDDIPGELMEKFLEISNHFNIPSVITSDAHFPRPEDHITEDIMLCIGTRQKINDSKRKIKLADYHYYGTETDILQRIIDMQFNASPEWIKKSLDNTIKIAESCEQVEIPKAGKFTYVGLEFKDNADDELWELIYNGVRKRMSQNQLLTSQCKEYFERACYEYNIIKKKGFCDYLLAVNDIVQQAKQKNELVMLRGSAAGCLLLWLMGASETDPIKHGLSFERFFDENRTDPPDVDMDFEKRKRETHIQYIFDKYGKDNCAQISNINVLKAKQAVQDTGRVFGIPRSEYIALSSLLHSEDEEVDKQIDAVSDPDALEVLRTYPQLRLAAGLVGQYRQSSIHAAGVIISPTPLADSVGVIKNKEGQQMVSMDKRGASYLGYLKMDMLSVNAYDVVAETLRKLNMPISFLYDLPLDDENVYRVAKAGKLAGIFQLSGGSALRVSKIIGLDSFNDLYAASALCRPGPSELVQTYAKNKHNPDIFQQYLSNMHPIVADIVKNTFGVMIYQEQVMRIARELAGFDWPDVHKLRKGIQDKLGLNPNTGAQWEEEWFNKFYNGCVTSNNVSKEEIEFLWENIKKYGAYGFNKSHACTYGQISYWMLWLKTYHTDYFYETYLQLETKNATIKSLVREYTECGGKVMLFDLNTPTAHFKCIEPKRIVGGFADLKGVGDITINRLLENGLKGEEFISKLIPSLQNEIRETGALSGQWNVQRLIALAPWFPIPTTGKREQEMKSKSFIEISYLLKCWGLQSDGNVTVMGYITDLEMDDEKIFFQLEDEGGIINARVPMKKVLDMKKMLENFRIGDFVAFEGWWSGEVLYIKQGLIALAAPDVKLENRNRKISINIEKYKLYAEKALARWRMHLIKRKGIIREKTMKTTSDTFINYATKLKDEMEEEEFKFWLSGIGKPNPLESDDEEFDHDEVKILIGNRRY